MAEIRPIATSATSASFVLGRKLDSIPFSGYHILIIAVLALVGFIEGYDQKQRQRKTATAPRVGREGV